MADHAAEKHGSEGPAEFKEEIRHEVPFLWPPAFLFELVPSATHEKQGQGRDGPQGGDAGIPPLVLKADDEGE
jgi:hypothetical protein